MNKTIHKLFKTSKMLLLLGAIFATTQVNVFNSTEKSMNENLNKTIDLTAMAVKLEQFHYEDMYYPLDTFTGDLTGYGPDCSASGCTGILYCRAYDSEGKLKYINALRDGITTYNDSVYGNVRIVASSKNLPCGSVITFNAKHISKEPIVAIVLDRGVLGNDIDLLTESQNYAYKNIGRKKISYDVLRFGWER